MSGVGGEPHTKERSADLFGRSAACSWGLEIVAGHVSGIARPCRRSDLFGRSALRSPLVTAFGCQVSGVSSSQRKAAPGVPVPQPLLAVLSEHRLPTTDYRRPTTYRFPLATRHLSLVTALRRFLWLSCKSPQ